MVEDKKGSIIILAEVGTSTIQIFNVVPQKVIQVDKPIGYYEDREKIKIYIY